MFYEHVERTAASVQLQLTGRATNTPLSIFLSLSLSLCITKRYECALSFSLCIYICAESRMHSLSLSFSASAQFSPPDTRLRPLILTA